MMAKLFLMMYVNNIVIGYSPEFVIHYYPACWECGVGRTTQSQNKKDMGA